MDFYWGLLGFEPLLYFINYQQIITFKKQTVKQYL